MRELTEVVQQAGTQVVTMAFEPGKAILGAALAIGGLIVAGFKFLGARIVASLDAVGQKVDATEKRVAKIDQELFGPDGQNGMRSDVKRMSRMLDNHDRVLIELALKNDLEPPEAVR